MKPYAIDRVEPRTTRGDRIDALTVDHRTAAKALILPTEPVALDIEQRLSLTRERNQMPRLEALRRLLAKAERLGEIVTREPLVKR